MDVRTADDVMGGSMVSRRRRRGSFWIGRLECRPSRLGGRDDAGRISEIIAIKRQVKYLCLIRSTRTRAFGGYQENFHDLTRLSAKSNIVKGDELDMKNVRAMIAEYWVSLREGGRGDELH